MLWCDAGRARQVCEKGGWDRGGKEGGREGGRARDAAWRARHVCERLFVSETER